MEVVRLAQRQRLLLRLIAHIQDGDVSADDPPLTRNVLRVGPDEPAVAHSEVETVAVNFHHVRIIARRRLPSYESLRETMRSRNRSSTRLLRGGCCVALNGQA